MRQLFLDTETTGLEAKGGHRIIEIGVVEMIDRRPTGRTLHHYLNPERKIDREAVEVHGITDESLRDKPKFADVAQEFMDFVRGAQWVIHNASFDLEFLDAELARVGKPGCVQLHDGVVDTIAMARDLWPGKRTSLTALCERLGVNDSERTLHGALLDAKLLAEVYLAMTRGQDSFFGEVEQPSKMAGLANALPADRGPLLVIQPTEAELAAHRAYLADIERESKGKCLWLALEREPDDAAADAPVPLAA